MTAARQAFDDVVDVKLKTLAAWVELADLLIVVGTTCQVTPASDLPVIANSHGAKVVVMNIGPTDVDQIAALRFDHETVGRLLPALLSEVQSSPSN